MTCHVFPHDVCSSVVCTKGCMQAWTQFGATSLVFQLGMSVVSVMCDYRKCFPRLILCTWILDHVACLLWQCSCCLVAVVGNVQWCPTSQPFLSSDCNFLQSMAFEGWQQNFGSMRDRCCQCFVLAKLSFHVDASVVFR